MYEAPNRYGVDLAARAVIAHDAVPRTTGTAWHMAEGAYSGWTGAPSSLKSTVPELTGVWPDVSPTLATTTISSP